MLCFQFRENLRCVFVFSFFWPVSPPISESHFIFGSWVQCFLFIYHFDGISGWLRVLFPPQPLTLQGPVCFDLFVICAALLLRPPRPSGSGFLVNVTIERKPDIFYQKDQEHRTHIDTLEISLETHFRVICHGLCRHGREETLQRILERFLETGYELWESAASSIQMKWSKIRSVQFLRATLFYCDAAEMFRGLRNFTRLSYQHGGRRRWLSLYFRANYPFTRQSKLINGWIKCSLLFDSSRSDASQRAETQNKLYSASSLRGTTAWVCVRVNSSVRIWTRGITNGWKKYCPCNRI